MGRACNVLGGDKKCIKMVGRPEGTRPLGRQRA
jgi:hypothetical protein